MKILYVVFLFSLFSLALLSCTSSEEPVWDEGNPFQGELSGNLLAPTSLNFLIGQNIIIGGSTPGADEECVGGTPYYPGHEPYTDAITFTLHADQILTGIIVQQLTVEEVHSACGTPLNEQLGAFTALAASSQIDWNADTFENFVKLPERNPLIGAGFAKDTGTDLLTLYQVGLDFGPYSIAPLNELPSDGTFTFWWKEGANRTRYELNFLVSEK